MDEYPSTSSTPARNEYSAGPRLWERHNVMPAPARAKANPKTNAVLAAQRVKPKSAQQHHQDGEHSDAGSNTVDEPSGDDQAPLHRCPVMRTMGGV